MSAKVLITGGAGFIGYHLARFLSEREQEVVLCDNLFRGRMDRELEKLLERGPVRFISCDLTSAEEMGKLGKGYDQVYHLAAINGTRFFYEVPHTVLRVNLLALINLLEWFVGNGAGKLLFASSSEVYAGAVRLGAAPVPTSERAPLVVDDIHNARHSYAISKIAGESLCLNYAQVHRFPVTIVRYHNVYGPRMGHEHVIPEFWGRILKREDPFKIRGSQESRAFCYVDDTVRATYLALKSPGTENEVLNVGDDRQEITILELAKLMFELSGFYPSLELLSSLPGSVPRRCPDISRLRELTGYEPQVDLAQGLKLTFDWYRSAVVP